MFLVTQNQNLKNILDYIAPNADERDKFDCQLNFMINVTYYTLKGYFKPEFQKDDLDQHIEVVSEYLAKCVLAQELENFIDTFKAI